jgi:hypothetical protein
MTVGWRPYFFNYPSLWVIETSKKGFMMTPKLFERLKCESQSENNKRNWDMLPNAENFWGKKGILELQDGD